MVVGGKRSDFLEVSTGMWQGSIIGPFLYNLYVQELPHVLDMECPHNKNSKNLSEHLFNDSSKLFGVILTFADDSSLTLKAGKGKNFDIAA